MTPAQRRVLDFVTGVIVRTGVSPTYAEIGTALNIKSRSTVWVHVANLVEQGHLRKSRNGADRNLLPTARFADVPTFMLVAELRRRGWTVVR
jgi:SOS-response transcriptional repressor LexA